MDSLKTIAATFYDAGLNVLPARRAEKRPLGAWSEWRNRRRPVDDAFDATDAIAVVCGASSGNVEVLDFDDRARDFDEFCERVARADPAVAARLFDCLVETTQSGGKHLAYRCEAPVAGNAKLCNRKILREFGAAFDAFEPTTKTTIETRGEGGIVIVAPTDGYAVVRGDWRNLPILTSYERGVLIDVARSMSDDAAGRADVPIETKAPSSSTRGDSVADWMRENGWLEKILNAHGWRYVKTSAGNELWARPGKRSGVSGTLHIEKRCFYVFTSNAAPLEPNRAYSALQLAAAYDFSGDERAAARFYAAERDAILPRPVAATAAPVPSEKKETVRKSNEFPRRLLEGPGLIGRIMSYIEAVEHKPQPPLRLAGALSLMSYLTLRKISSNGGRTRTNLHVVGVAESGAGKDAARFAISRILTTCGAPSFPEQYKSDVAFWKTVANFGAVFSRIDEFGLYLRAINNDGGFLNRLATAFMAIYSASCYENYTPPLGASEALEPIDFPSFTLYGTTTPIELGEALVGRQLTNGFLSRCTIIEGVSDAPRNYRDFEGYVTPEPPENLRCEIVRWLKFRAALACETPTAYDAPVDADANARLRAFAERADAVLTSDEEPELKNFFVRALEKCQKYSLIFAASKFGADETALRVDRESVELAVELVEYEYRYYKKFIVEEHVETESEKLLRDAKRWLASIPDKRFTKSQFTRKFQRAPSREREATLQTLVDAEYIEKTALKLDRATKIVYTISEDILV